MTAAQKLREIACHGSAHHAASAQSDCFAGKLNERRAGMSPPALPPSIVSRFPSTLPCFAKCLAALAQSSTSTIPQLSVRRCLPHETMALASQTHHLDCLITSVLTNIVQDAVFLDAVKSQPNGNLGRQYFVFTIVR